MSSTVNLTGTDYVSNIPAVYYSTTSSLVEKFASQEAGSIIAKTTLPGGTVISSTINLVKDPDNPGKIIASTVAASGITYFVSLSYGSAAIAVTEVLIGSIAVTLGVIASPAVITLSAIGVVAIGTTILGNEIQSVLYDALASYEQFNFFSPEVTGRATQDQFILQSAANDPDFCKRMFPEYIGYRQIVQIKSGTELFLYNTVMKKAEVTTIESTEVYEIEAIRVVADTIDDVKHITINSRTLDIRNLTSVELRNAVEHIDKVSFLLSNILIKVGEKLDMGSYGIYTVKGGDTLSQIAQSHGMVTKQLVELNTWLIDDGRIQFNYPTKILLDSGTPINNNNEHRLDGSNADDILIDHNGGEDWLVGNGGDDYLDGGAGNDRLIGGTGFDTYITGDGDTIEDSDGSGTVKFEGSTLTGGSFVSESGGFKTYEGDGGLYILQNDGTLIFSKNGNFLTIEKYDQKIKALGITLTEELELTVIGNMANENDTEITGKVVLTKAYSQDITVNFYTLDDSATSGSDYTGKTNIQVTIKAGETEGEFSVTLLDDSEKEGRETFFAVVDSVKGTDNSELTYTIKDIQPFTIEDDSWKYAA